MTLSDRLSPKGPGDENFPVASRLLPARLRPVVLAFYRFARAADDLADDPAVTEDAKLDGLGAMAQALDGPDDSDSPAAALRRQLQECGLSPAPAHDLLAAFRQDAVQSGMADWGALLAYCRLSAVPVGRFLLALHGEDPTAHAAADALCAALQIINHLQDCARDYRTLGRVYLPQDWMKQAGVDPADLSAPTASPALRRVLDRVIDATEDLMDRADYLPVFIRQRGLRVQCRVTIANAHALLRKLRRADPLAGPVTLSALDWLRAGWFAFLGRDPLAAKVRHSRSSFYWAMRCLPLCRRRAVYGVYAFCRLIDDIADGPQPASVRLARLDQWRRDIDEWDHGGALAASGRAHPLLAVLSKAQADFGLDWADLQAVVAGCAMDARGEMIRPSQSQLDLYCDRVASAVGRLCLPIFGAKGPGALAVASSLGLALQFTNILRDLDEDAGLDRLYLADEMLAAHGIMARDPMQVLADPAMGEVRRYLAVQAAEKFAQARRDMAACLADKSSSAAALRPAKAMLAIYEDMLHRLQTGRPPRASKLVKLWRVLRA